MPTLSFQLLAAPKREPETIRLEAISTHSSRYTKGKPQQLFSPISYSAQMAVYAIYSDSSLSQITPKSRPFETDTTDRGL
jgi:hypothetical protein